MTAHQAFYVLPLFPVLTRAVLYFRWPKVMADRLSEEAQERDVQRTFIFALAGFSFTAVAAFAALDSTVRVGLQLPTWYVLASFVSLVSALNVQSYKSSRWQNQLATALLEVGTLSLMLALVALLFTAHFGCAFQFVATAVTLGPWLIDHGIRLAIEDNYLSRRNKKIP
jgi:hypothetical protein